MKNYKALVRYLDRKTNTIEQVWLNIQAADIKVAWAEAKASFTTLEVVEV